MKHEAIKKLNDGISELISDRKMLQALDTMIETCHKAEFYQLADRINTLRGDYEHMLDYYAVGAADPARSQMFAHINNEAWTLLDTLIDALEREGSRAYYYAQQRMLAQRGLTLARLADDFALLCRDPSASEVDAMAETLFLAIWTNFPSTRDDRSHLRSLLLDDAVPSCYRGAFVAALTLNLLAFFDAEKAEDLYTYTLSDQPADVSQRAWVAILLVATKYTYRIDHLPRLQEQLKFIAENPKADDGSPFLLRLQLQILQCVEAEAAKRKLEDEISPAIRRGLKEMQKRRSQTDDDRRATVIRLDEEGQNPEWESFIKRTRLRDKIADFIRMQAEGTDVMLDAFVAMRHLPFFSSMMHWLLPYDVRHESIAQPAASDPSVAAMARVIDSNSGMCNTDRYSNFMSVLHMPRDQREAMVEQLRTHGFDPAREVKHDDEDVSRAYLHDLYRLFSLAPHRREWENPFDERDLLDLNSSPWLAPAVESIEARKLVADYLFDKQRWPEAVGALERLLELSITEEALQKLAYAANQPDVDDPVLVREALVSCNNLYPDKEWTLRYMAAFYIREEEYASAELVLDHALSIYPDDIDLLNKYATCLMCQHRYREAFEPLYKADLTQEGQIKTQRNLAWCYFMVRNNEKAEQYIRAVVERKGSSRRKGKAVANDWLNAGHIALQAGNINLALERYRKCLSNMGKKFEDVEKAFYDDWQDVLDAGVGDADLSLALDALRRASGV